jgi:hypothetical protein
MQLTYQSIPDMLTSSELQCKSSQRNGGGSSDVDRGNAIFAKAAKTSRKKQNGNRKDEQGTVG